MYFMEDPFSWLQKEKQLLEMNYHIDLEIPTSILCHFCYTNRENEIISINTERYKFKDNLSIITEKNLIDIIHEKKKVKETDREIIYDFDSLLTFYLDIDFDRISLFNQLQEPIHPLEYEKYVKKYPIVKDISFSKTLSIFQDINCLFFLFRENYQENHKESSLKSILKNGPKRHTKKIVKFYRKQTKKREPRFL